MGLSMLFLINTFLNFSVCIFCKLSLSLMLISPVAVNKSSYITPLLKNPLINSIAIRIKSKPFSAANNALSKAQGQPLPSSGAPSLSSSTAPGSLFQTTSSCSHCRSLHLLIQTLAWWPGHHAGHHHYLRTLH